MKSRSLFFRVSVAVFAAAGIASIVGCLGSRSYFAGRPVPPSTILQRVLVSVQNPSATSQGALQFVDARYDIRGSLNGRTPSFVIGAYSGTLPTTILNYPEETSGYVYNSGTGSISPVNYSTEQSGTAISTLPGISNSVFVTSSGQYVFAANQPSQYATVIDNVIGAQVSLNLPNVYKVAVNPSGTVALALVQNSNYAYRFIRLQQPNGTVMPVPTFPNEGTWAALGVSPINCQPVNLPIYCIVPVTDQAGNPVVFNRPYTAIFSSDGTTAWMMNCGPECGNTAVDPVIGAATASVSFLNTAALNIYNFPGSDYPSPPPATPLPTEQTRLAVPGGATMAVYGNGTLYVSGQQPQSDGLFEGFLSVVNLTVDQPTTNKITATYPISDGTHTKMLLGDDSTLWIGSQQCQTGYRTANNLVNGCLTLFNLANNNVLVEPAYGDLTGLCAILEWHKMYTAQGGQLHVYATTSWNGMASGATGSNSGFAPGIVVGSELSNFTVTVQGTAYDVAYMDAPSDAGD